VLPSPSHRRSNLQFRKWSRHKNFFRRRVNDCRRFKQGQAKNQKRSKKEGLPDELQEGVGGETASVTKHKTRTQTSSSSTSNTQEDVDGGGTEPAGLTRDNKRRSKSSDSATSSKKTNRKGVNHCSKKSLDEATVEEPSVKKTS
jgi:hypothetical protein